MDPQLYGQIMFDKAGKNIQWKKDSLFSKWCWQNWTAICRRMKLDHSLKPYTKINLKWIKHLNVRQESIKILEENIGSNLFDIGHSSFFQDMSPKAKKQKWKWTLGTSSRSKASAQQRKYSTKQRDNAQMGEDICKWHYRQRTNIQDVERTQTQHSKKQIITSKNGQKTWTDTSPKETYE